MYCSVCSPSLFRTPNRFPKPTSPKSFFSFRPFFTHPSSAVLEDDDLISLLDDDEKGDGGDDDEGSGEGADVFTEADENSSSGGVMAGLSSGALYNQTLTSVDCDSSDPQYDTSFEPDLMTPVNAGSSLNAMTPVNFAGSQNGTPRKTPAKRFSYKS